MVYIYSCLKCKRDQRVEVSHSMDYVGRESELPKDILAQITCKQHGLMSRVPQVPHLAGSSGGTFKSERELVKEKQDQRKLRSKTQFKNDILPKLKLTPNERRHFNKKLKNIKGDHEKMK